MRSVLTNPVPLLLALLLAPMLALPLAALPGCGVAPRAEATPAQAGPRLRVLGIAQDGGVPHAGCSCPTCEAAAADPARRHFVASLALILPQADGPARVYLIDATPDLIPQLRLLADVRDGPPGLVDRSPVDGVFLTHAHMGHYAGLLHFGFESMHAQGTPVWATQRMGAFLTGNAPWSQLVEKQEIELRTLTPGQPVDLGGVTVTPFLVPHRAEFTDTCAFLIRGPDRTAIYIPDCDPWQRWEASIGELLIEHGVQIAIVDATFYSVGELPGRHIASIGHPLVEDTLVTLRVNVNMGMEVRLIHLNHTNPLLDPASPERERIDKVRGFAVAREGEEIGL